MGGLGGEEGGGGGENRGRNGGRSIMGLGY